MTETITFERLVELAIPKLDDKRTHAVRIDLANGSFLMTEEDNRFVPQFFADSGAAPRPYNLCVLHGYGTTVLS